MQTGFKFKAYPSQTLAAILLQWIGSQRFIYNAKVREDRYFRAWQRKTLALTGMQPPVDQQYAQFKTELTPWMRQIPSQVLRNGAYRFAGAYARFYQRLGGRPTLKTRYGRQSVLLTRELFRFTRDNDSAPWVLTLGTEANPVGQLPFQAAADFAPPAMIYIAIDAGRWSLSFSNEVEGVEYTETEVADWLKTHSDAELAKMTFGGDRGIAIPLAGNHGEMFDFSPSQKQHLDKAQRYQRKWQRIAARRQLGSKNRAKANRRAARYAKTRGNIRLDFAHQTSHQLAKSPYRLFVFEDLKIKNMTASAKGTVEQPGKRVAQKAGLNKAILASAWGMTHRFLQYKALRRHKLVIRISPYQSSQECSQCGCIDPDNRLKQALFVCQDCGHTENADTNAGKVLAKRGIDALLTGKWQPRKVKRVRVRRGECSDVKPVEPVLAVADDSVPLRSGRRSRKVLMSEEGRETPTIAQA